MTCVSSAGDDEGRRRWFDEVGKSQEGREALLFTMRSSTNGKTDCYRRHHCPGQPVLPTPHNIIVLSHFFKLFAGRFFFSMTLFFKFMVIFMCIIFYA